jgi:hypothetical protein
MKSILIVSLLAMTIVPAFAQQSPSQAPNDPLQSLCSGFLEQSGQSVSGNANKLCACLVRETKARLTPQEMAVYSRASETGQTPPPSVMEKVIAVATTCLTAQ